MKKVLVLPGYAPSWAYRMASALPFGWEATFLGHNPNNLGVTGSPLDELNEVAPRRYEANIQSRLPGRLQGTVFDKRASMKLSRAISSLEEELGSFDVIHAHWYSSVSSLDWTKCPVVVTEHSNVFGRHLRRATSESRNSINLAKRVYRRSRLIAPVSNHLRGLMADCGVDTTGFVVVPNPVDERLFGVINTDSGLHRPVDGALRLLTVGRLANTKNHRELVKAISDLANDFRLHLKIIGVGPEANPLENLVRELGLEQSVELCGELSQSSVAAAMKTADLYVQSSEVESFGVPVVEAMMSGLPVVATPVGVASDLPSLPGVWVAQGTGFRHLVDAIRSALLGLQGVETSQLSAFAVDNFGLDAVGRKLNDLYDKALSA